MTVVRRMFVGFLLAWCWLPLAQAAGLTTLQGEARSLEDFTGDGQWTVVMIWASDCVICNREAYQYVDFHTFHKDKDARVLGISMDGSAGLAEAKDFIARHSINFPNLIGTPEAVAGLFANATGQSLRGTPTFMIFDPQGKLRAADAGAVPAEVISEFIASNSPS